MRKKLEKCKKFISMVLTLCIILSLMPAISSPVFATSSDDYNVFNALGIDQSVTPEGFDADSNDNPYGVNTINVMPVSELFVADNNGNKLYGHNKSFLKDSEPYYTGETISSFNLTNGMDYFNSVSGDFTGNGLNSEIVVLGAGFDSSNKINSYNLFFDSTNNITPSNVKALAEDENYTNYCKDVDFTNDKSRIYNIQKYLKIAAGDFTGDGIDEIAVYIPEAGKSKIVIYCLQIPNGETAETSWSNANNWTALSSYSIDSNGSTPNQVTLRAEDYTGDGIHDLGISWGLMDGSTKVLSKIQILKGSKESTDRFEPISIETEDLYQVSFATGDIDGDRKNEFVVAGYLTNNDYRFVHLSNYEYNDETEKFICRNKNNINTFTNTVAERNFTAQITTINTKGMNEKNNIYVDGALFELTDGKFIKNFGNSQLNIDYDITAVDLTGNGKEKLVLKRIDKRDIVQDNGDKPDTTITIYVPITSVWTVSNNFYNYTDLNSQKYSTVCNTDEDTVQMNFKGKRVVYSDPKILAVLASPPYFKDLEHLDGGDSYVGNSATSYGTSEGSSSSHSTTSTISAGTYTSFEQEFSFFGLKAASVEAEAEFSKSWTNETEKTSSRTQTIEYSTAGGQDTVVLYSIPLVIYEYEMKFPVVNSEGFLSWKTQKSTITEPREATIRTFTLASYDGIAKYYNILPTIGGDVLKHTLGNPATYPTSTAGYRNVNQPTGPSIGVGYGTGGSITQTLEFSEETSVGTSSSVSISTKAGGGAGGVTAGVTAGSESGSGSVQSSLNGKFFSTTIVGMPEEANDYDYDYNVKMFQYTKKYAGQTFPVVNYVVSQLSMPPVIPEDFGMDREKTTANQIKLTWTDDANGDNIVGYNIFKQYDFPDGTADFPIAFVSANEKDSNNVFSFIDTNLTPNTQYKYKIQVLGNEEPDISVKSDALTIKTRASVGNPEITLDGLENNIAKVYSDVEKTITATVSNTETNVGDPIYQWQKYTNGQWNNLSGQTLEALTFTNANLSVNGYYRLRVNQFVKENAVSVYSDVFRVEFSKRDIESDGITVIKKDNENVVLSVLLSNNNSATKPTGNVVFKITGEGYSKTLVQSLDNTSTAKTEEITFPQNGLYVINAYYSGNIVFNSTDISKKYLKANENESVYWLEVDDFIYGNSVSPIITEYKIESTLQTSKDITSDTDYTIEYSYTNENGNPISNAVNVGQYNMTAVVKQGTATLSTLTKDFCITQKPITITAPTLEKVRSEAKTPELSTLITTPALVNSDALADLGLKIICLDNMGREVDTFNTDNPSNPLPGRYTMRVLSKNSLTTSERTKQSNYEMSFIDGTYCVIGATHKVTMTADKLLQKSVGKLELISPEDTPTLEFQQNTLLSFQATADAGYEIDKWFLKTSTSDYQEVAPTEENKNIYKISMPGEAIEVKAIFKVKETNINFSATNGVITCVEIPNLKTGDIVTKNGKYSFTATANAGYHFVKWQKTENNHTVYPTGTTNANGNPQIELTVGDYDVSLFPIFERDSYNLNLSDNLRAYYMDGHNKVYITGSSIIGDTEVKIEPAVGYDVSQNNEGTYLWNSNVDGNISSDGQVYTFTITDNTIIAATLETTKLTTKVNIAEGSFGDNTIVLKINGNITPYTLGESLIFESGSTITLEPTLDYGAKLKQYDYNHNTSTEKTLTLENVTENLEITATFEELNKYAVDFSAVDNKLHGELNIEVVGHDVNLDSTNNLPVYNGDTVSITAQPNSGYMVGYWTIDGIRTSSNEKVKTFENITDNHIVKCEFIPLVYYNLTYSAADNGTVTVVKDDVVTIDSNVKIGGGSKLVFTATPDENYMVEKWTVNGEEVKNTYDQTYVDKAFTINALSENSDVKVYFTPEVTHQITITPSEGITMSKKVIPNDYPETNKVRNGVACIITVTADTHHRLDAVNANDIALDDSQITKNEDGSWTCTISSVNTDITIVANTTELYDINLGTFNGGTVTATASPAPAGATINIAAKPSNSHYFKEWTVTDEENNEITLDSKIKANASFTMPAKTVTVTPVFMHKNTNSGGSSIVTPPVVEKDPIEEAFEQSHKNAEGKTIATVEAKKVTNKNAYEQEISKDFFKNSDKILNVSTPEGTVALPNDMFDNAPSKDIQVSLEKVDIERLNVSEDVKKQIGDKPIIDINLKIGGQKTKWKSEDKEITLSIPYTLTEKEKAEPHKIIAVYIDDDGNITPLTSSDYDAKNGAIIFKTNHTSYYSLQYVDKSFEDIGSYTWAEDAIEALAVRGVINGVSATEFAPQNDITRADFVTLITRFFNFNNSNNANFDDVKEGAYYYDAIATAKDLGIIMGNGKNTFNPNEKISRQDMMVIVERALKIANATTKLTEDSGKSLDNFVDKNTISSYADSSVDYLIRKGIVSGNGLNVNPKSNTKRAEIAVLLYKLLDQLNN